LGSSLEQKARTKGEKSTGGDTKTVPGERGRPSKGCAGGGPYSVKKKCKNWPVYILKGARSRSGGGVRGSKKKKSKKKSASKTEN